ncbi:hypothetical protein CALVIDRAFT_327268 [Calocera viscosa TUFC12733]|uniref:Uncharacterized protein n=1 Tax=Calocera viscosa (strain TUFC12733) TaxID=1330018 RepID=A0A167QVQ9_CALVF|nr:hypothetical protein CALVIDRAFT_327268 [Calocera viscosa TUFC12733]
MWMGRSRDTGEARKGGEASSRHGGGCELRRFACEMLGRTGSPHSSSGQPEQRIPLSACAGRSGSADLILPPFVAPPLLFPPATVVSSSLLLLLSPFLSPLSHPLSLTKQQPLHPSPAQPRIARVCRPAVPTGRSPLDYVAPTRCFGHLLSSPWTQHPHLLVYRHR